MIQNLPIFLDPMKLEVEYTYNLHVLKEIRVTDSFLTLPEDVRNCQDQETFEECSPNRYVNHIVNKCKCLPFHLLLENEVRKKALNF